MKIVPVFYITALFMLCLSCSKEQVVLVENNSNPHKISTLSFNSKEELSYIAHQIEEKNNPLSTKTIDGTIGFTSLWENKRDEFLSTLSKAKLKEAQNNGLYYEPEDEIINDPTFAKILNPKREVIISGNTYRYVETGVLIYNNTANINIIENFIPSNYTALKEKEEVILDKGIKFIRLNYNNNSLKESIQTKLPTLDPGLYGDCLILKDGSSIPNSNIRFIEYGTGNGDANGFQKGISSVFGTSVVAENYFDAKHRMKLRTFSQDFYIYTSVGMTVRMQQKKFGVWWRKKAQEFRYGWSAVECHYSYKGPSFPSGVNFQKAEVITHDYSNYYKKPLVLFSVPAVDFNFTSSSVSSLIKSLLEKNQSRINYWLNNNPNYKNNPYSFFNASNENSYSILFPPYEDIATNNGREKVNWDFRIHATLGVKIGGGGAKPKFTPIEDPEKIEIRRGEIYAAVKYDNTWKACVIYTK